MKKLLEADIEWYKWLFILVISLWTYRELIHYPRIIDDQVQEHIVKLADELYMIARSEFSEYMEDLSSDIQHGRIPCKRHRWHGGKGNSKTIDRDFCCKCGRLEKHQKRSGCYENHGPYVEIYYTRGNENDDQ